ncbi:hypothetical protein ASPBRDRAFT_105943, partial [Aspergillus brasiliensis CBS 101740]
GDFQGAQFYRLRQVRCPYYDIRKRLWGPIAKYIQVGHKLRFCVQREVYLKAKHDMLYEQLNLDPSTDKSSTWVTEMQTYKEKLQSLPEAIWSLERDTHRCMIAIPDGPLKRMLCAHVKRKDWYLSQWLREECARSGGCCARGCGCCERPRNDERPQHRGHCTSMCLCCEKARGCTIKIDDYDNDAMLVDVFVMGF